MKEFLAELRSAVLVTVVFAVVCCGLYPLVVYGFAQALFHDKANGSLIADATGTSRGSRLIVSIETVGASTSVDRTNAESSSSKDLPLWTWFLPNPCP